MTIKDSLIEFYERDLKQVAEEIRKYDNDEAIWLTSGSISNSAGNLALHICGNLRHFVGNVLGGTGYVRERDKEFSTKGLTRETVANLVDECRKELVQVLGDLDNETLHGMYPIRVLDRDLTTIHFLAHLATHLSYHLGQLNYHRRKD